ncbi:MAG: hypothetical protein ACREQ5_34975, partial [Candidatus Dormibacteria bacterium]
MSKEILKSELDIFEKPSVQYAIEKTDIVQHRPIESITGTDTIEFNVQSGPDEYIDTQNIFLHLTGKLVNRENGDDFKDSLGTKDNYAPINYCLNTAFQELNIYLNGTLISHSSNNYPYLSYIEALTDT